MKAMILAAGLGTRLRPMTWHMPKPMVPVLNRPVMDHIARLLGRHGFAEVVANLHYFPDAIRDYFGEGEDHGLSLSWSFEEELLGTAGGVRNCSGFFGEDDFLIISGDALTDIDLRAMREFHEGHGGVATLAVKKVPDTREYGVVIHDEDGRIQGFQEKPDPAEALSDLGNCGIYMFRPEIFDYFPKEPFVDWAHDVFPTLLEGDVPFYVHEIDAYWNDVGSIDEYRQSNFDALTGSVAVERGVPAVSGDVWSASDLDAARAVEGPVHVGASVSIGKDVRLDGPVVVGDGARIGDGAMLRDAIVWPGATVPVDHIEIGGIVGPADVSPHLRSTG